MVQKIAITHSIAPVNLHSSIGVTGVSECLSDSMLLGYVQRQW